MGSFQTPQIRELSGIGNPEVLSKYGIETLVNCPLWARTFVSCT